VNVPRPYLVAIVALLVIIAGALVWQIVPETCSHWRDRYVNALRQSIYAVTPDDRAAAHQVASERPEGCN
jgi:hypothetical protein